MDFRVAIIVPPESPIHVVADLKGKTLGIPFGASTHRVALQMLKNAGLRPGSDVKILNIDITEQSDIVKSAGGKNWPSVDALASWDHHIALFEKQGLARVLREGTALGVVMMSQSFIAKHQDAATQFIAAYLLAYLYYATHENQVNTWFADATGGKLDPKLLTAVAAVEPNLRARELDAISIEIGPDHIAALQQAADFAHAQGLIKGSLRVRDFVVAQPSAQARQLVHERAFDIQPVLEGRP
jgi:ABC-type nitrate/sulfonate/bicarbonate transport system substrate-binding protein